MQINIEQPDQAKLIQQANGVAQGVDILVIDSPDMYEYAGSELKAVKKRISDLETRRKEITKPLDDAKKSVMDLFRTPIERYTAAETAIKNKMIVYGREQERIRAEAQRKADEEARKERERILAESARKEDEARAERERLNREAEEAASKGRLAEAERLQQQAQENSDRVAVENQAALETAATITAPKVEAAAPKVAGTAFVEIWKGICNDVDALFVHAYNNREHRVFFTLNQSELNNYAKRLQAQAKLPGCAFMPETSMRSRKA